MAKLVERPNPPSNNDPFVKWVVELITLQSSGELAIRPPRNPKGYTDGHWTPTSIEQLGNNRLLVGWTFKPGPNEREKRERLERAADALFNAVQHLCCQRQEPVTTRDGRPIVIPDTSDVRWVWEMYEKWARALRGDND